MTGGDTSGRMWRIGELAAATGLTVRALRHYEQLGLLTPSARTEGGHRIYDDRQVEILYRIRALKSLGMSLTEIGDGLDESSLAEVLKRHLDRVDHEQRRLRRLSDRIRRLTAYTDEPIPTDRLVELLSAMRHLERELSPRQLDRIAERRAALGAEGARAVERDWRELATLLRAEMSAHTPPDSARVQEIAQRARANLERFTGGEPVVYRALDRLRQHLPPEGLAGWDAELLDYLYTALAAGPTT